MAEILNSYTFRLFKKRSSSPLIEGAASILDSSDNNHLYHYDNNDKEADSNSLRDDWLQVGQDLQNVIEEYATIHTNKTNRNA
ncbi:MAG: hypothetical protein WAP52_03070 [Candidatus Sungiibacteriota bacterium]